MSKIDIFGVRIDNLTMEETLKRIKGFLENGKQHYIVLPYSEFIVRAQKDREFRKILNKADLCLCEGRGLWLIARFLGKKLKENIYGVELIYKLVNNEQQTMNSIFLLGGIDEAIKRTADRLGNCVVGYEHGHGDLSEAINKINKIKPEILLVGLGSPKQEKWIYENLKKMPSVKTAIGVGGAFDFISGRIKREPRVFQKIGLEWLWRLTLQPWRAKRIYRGVLGLSWLVLKEKIRK